MSAGIFISRAELEALQGLSHLAARIYLVLRRLMDYGTGLVGQLRRISYQALREECETVIPRGAGWQRVQPTIKELRIALAGLSRAGLVRQEDGFVFWLPLAATASARPKRTGQSEGTVWEAASPVSMRVSGHPGQATPRHTGHTSELKEKQLSTVAAAFGTPGAGDNSPAAIAAVFLEKLAERLGYPIRYSLQDRHLAGWVAAGLTFDAVERAVRSALEARKRDGSRAPLNPGYIAAFIGEDQAEDWRQSWSGIVAKGAELGLAQAPGEIAPAFKARVFAAVETQEVTA